MQDCDAEEDSNNDSFDGEGILRPKPRLTEVVEVMEPASSRGLVDDNDLDIDNESINQVMARFMGNTGSSKQVVHVNNKPKLLQPTKSLKSLDKTLSGLNSNSVSQSDSFSADSEID